MRRIIRGPLVLVLLTLAGCASLPRQEAVNPLFADEQFTAPATLPATHDLFALDAAMQQYLHERVIPALEAKSPGRALFDALYQPGQLRLEYDSTLTRTAAQAFAARAGNCLSLVVMTAAFAKALGIDVQYEQVLIDSSWSRSDPSTWLSSSHVTLTLGRRVGGGPGSRFSGPLRIDFLQPEESRVLHTRVIDEPSIVAMFRNNRAVELLIAGDLDAAYWWARAAIDAHPKLMSAYNTLGVVYRRHGDLDQAERVFRHVVAREPGNEVAMSNQVQVLQLLGRADEAAALKERLAKIEGQPPFLFFEQGLAAMRQGDFYAARRLFTKEIERDSSYHEFHFWLGMANFLLGEAGEAKKHLAMAIENSTTPREQALYSGKLELIRQRLREHRLPLQSVR